jgi:hypothetical protein
MTGGVELYSAKAGLDGYARFNVTDGSYFVILRRYPYPTQVLLQSVSSDVDRTFTINLVMSYSGLFGQITGPDSFEGATVSVYSGSTLVKKASVDKNGFYLMAFIPEGNYDLIVNSPGFAEKKERRSLVISEYLQFDAKLEQEAPVAKPLFTGSVLAIDLTQSDINEFRGYADAINSSRNRNYQTKFGPAEQTCFTSGTFLSRRPCSDLTSCKQTASIVCVMGGGMGCSIDLLATHILSYSQAIEALNQGYVQVYSATTLEQMEVAFNLLKNGMDGVKNSKLRYPETGTCIDCLGLCPEAHLDYTALIAAQSKIGGMRPPVTVQPQDINSCADGTQYGKCSSANPGQYCSGSLSAPTLGLTLSICPCSSFSGYVQQGSGDTASCVASRCGNVNANSCDPSNRPKYCVNGQLVDNATACGCPTGQTPNSNGRVCDTNPARQSCANDLNCDNWQVCDASAHRCISASGFCGSSADCPVWELCNTQSHRCEAKRGLCTSLADCGSWQICDVNSKRCINLPGYCTSDTDCPVYQKCDAASHKCAVRAGYCTTSADCAYDERCETDPLSKNAYKCVKAVCGSDADCPVYQKCDAASHKCAVRAGYCTTSADCAYDERCETDPLSENAYRCVSMSCPIENTKIWNKSNVTAYHTVIYVFDRGYNKTINESYNFEKQSWYSVRNKYGGQDCSQLLESVSNDTPIFETQEPTQELVKTVSCSRCPIVCTRNPPSGLECGSCSCPDNLGFCEVTGLREQQNQVPAYCFDELWQPQKNDDAACQNNFECKSNFCSNGVCYNIASEIKQNKDLLQTIVEWLKSMFNF